MRYPISPVFVILAALAGPVATQDAPLAQSPGTTPLHHDPAARIYASACGACRSPGKGKAASDGDCPLAPRKPDGLVQIMQAVALIAHFRKPTDADCDAVMSGNLCRCMIYERICTAIKQAALKSGA